MPTPYHHFFKFAHYLADQTEPVLQAYFRESLEVEDKSDESPVTKADKEVEQILRRLIQKDFPTHGILGEEFSASHRESEYQWVIDPIDGTRSFITGRPLFGTLIALFKDGEPIIGIINQPITRERWSAEKDMKTLFTSTFGGHVGTRKDISLNNAEIACTSPDMLRLAPTQNWINVKRAAKRMSWGGDCYNYGLLAIGGIDLIIECDMKPWDWGALIPIIQGAGGIITQWDGTPLSLNGDGTVLASSCKKNHRQAVEILYPPLSN